MLPSQDGRFEEVDKHVVGTSYGLVFWSHRSNPMWLKNVLWVEMIAVVKGSQERGAEIVMIINTCLFWRVLMVAVVAGGEALLAGISRGPLEGCATEPPLELGIIR